MHDPNRIAVSQTRAVSEALDHLVVQAVQRGRPADKALTDFFRRHRKFGSRDRRLIGDTVFAVFRWWGWLRRLAPASLCAEMKSLGGNAPAATTESLEAVFLGARLLEGAIANPAAQYWASACGIAPGELKRLCEEPDPVRRMEELCEVLKMPGREPCTQESLLPAWTLEQAVFPVSPQEWVPWFQRRPPLWLRIQHRDEETVLQGLRDAGLEPALHPTIPSAVSVRKGAVNLTALPAYRQGAVEVQDLASQAVGAVCAPGAGERWWDACAGGGGKSLLLADRLRGGGTVLAGDIRAHKLQELRRRAHLGRFSNIKVMEWDGKEGADPGMRFDGVLVDAPCSGSGTWRRNPVARWGMRAADLAGHAELQWRLLHSASAAVRPGGRLVYATCSFFTVENDGVVDRFLGTHSDFTLETFEHPLTGASCSGLAGFWPWQGDCDVMFVARFRRGKP